MKKVVEFLKGTKIASRVLFVLWIVFSTFSNFANESKLLEIFDFTIVFLFPAIVNELCKNPVFAGSNYSFFKFMQNTKTISRVFLQLWAFFGLIGAGSVAKKFLYTFPIAALVFLIPAVIIEILNNKRRKQEKNTGIFNNEEKNSNIFASKIKTLYKSTQIASRILFFIWLGYMLIFGFATLNKIFTIDIFICIFVCMSAFFLIPIILIECNKNSMILSKNPDKYISKSKILAIVCLGFAIIGLTGSLTTNSNLYEALPPTIIFSVASLICWLVSLRAPKTKTEAAERKIAKIEREKAKREQIEHEQRMAEYKGIFLTEEQIRKIENGIELPILDTPLFLKNYEVAVYDSVATRRVNTRQGYMHYTGEVVFTNERIVFLSDEKGFEVKYNAITTASAYSDGLYIQSRGNSYEILLPKTELAATVFDAVRTGEIPIGKAEIYEEIDIFEDEEIETDDFSMIDFMDGHEFEYFCADVLKKNGFSNVSVTKASGDQGVDILATKDGIKYAIQCKNYSSALSNTPIQEVNAGKTFYNCHVGVVMTNSTFTSGAKTLAEATGVLLWDREILQEMMDKD